MFGQKVKESNDKIEQVVTFIEKWVQTASTKELLMFQASLEFKMAMLLSQLPKLDLASTVQLEFISNFQSDKNDDDADFKIIVTVKKLWKQVQEDGVISNGSNNSDSQRVSRKLLRISLSRMRVLRKPFWDSLELLRSLGS